ncbi:hypothetical protein ABMC89_10375 [Sulfitobacter sp. HNIBRBA3233]|uniref:hypothetical protein n=1 Tax=Sulfitobacter marinivivus TaxID=3158558 RepID=UPI0032DED246
MTTEMFLGGLMVLTLVAGVVIAMTNTRNSTDRRLDDSYSPNANGGSRSQSKR